MKTTRLFFALAVCAAFASCSKDGGGDPTPKAGVEINGVTWSEFNVAAPGKFTSKAEDYGMFYKWGSNVGWSATGDPVSSPAGKAWADVTPESGASWLAANDPCPAGWRVPTKEQQDKLFKTANVDKEWVSSPTNGYKFTDKASGKSIFLPAAGLRYSTDGPLGSAGYLGYYWSSSSYSDVLAWLLYFDSGEAFQPNGIRTSGFPVRCVLQ